MISVEAACAMPPFIEGPARDTQSHANTLYRVWLPSDSAPGVVETRPRYDYERSRKSHYYDQQYNLELLAPIGAMTDILTETGFSTARTGNTTFTTFPSLANLVAYTEKRWRLARQVPPFIRFRGFDGATFSDVEFLTNLRDGFVLISNSVKSFHEHTDGNLYVTENHPRLLHDILLHAPAWICMPPAITHELQQAAAQILEEKEQIIARGEPLYNIDFRISQMMGRIDSAVNTYDLLGALRRPKDALLYSGFGHSMGNLTGRSTRKDAFAYEQLVRDYVANPFLIGRRRSAAHLASLASNHVQAA